MMYSFGIAMRADLSERISSAPSGANCLGTGRVKPWLFIWLFWWIAMLDLEMGISPFNIPISQGWIERTNWLFFTRTAWPRRSSMGGFVGKLAVCGHAGDIFACACCCESVRQFSLLDHR
jgi:hypothetical protein